MNIEEVLEDEEFRDAIIETVNQLVQKHVEMIGILMEFEPDTMH